MPKSASYVLTAALAVLPLAAGAADLSAQDAAGAATTERIEGTYLYVPTRSDDIAAAIERGIEDMNFITRRIARGRLERTNSPYQTVSVDLAEAGVTTIYDGRPIRSPRDGRTVRWQREDGEVFQVSTTLEGGVLTQRFVAEDGSRENELRLSPDGRTLTMRVTLRSPRLPAPIVYRLVFDRQS